MGLSKLIQYRKLFANYTSAV